MNKFVIRLSIALALGAGLVVIAPAQHAGAAYTSAQIEDMLENGVATAHSMDAYCFDYMRSLGYSSNFTSTGYGDLRTVINEGSAYDYATWLSKRGHGNAAVPVTVNAGTTVLPLQINDVLFLCGPLVRPNLDDSPPCSTSIYGRDILYANGTGGTPASRWIVNDWNANDRAPNAFGSGCMYPAKAFERTKIVSLSVAGNSTIPGWVSGGSGSVFNTFRNNTSRYWFATPIGFDFHTNSPISSSGRIHIVMRYKKFSAYHTTNEYNATKSCQDSGPQFVSGAWLNVDSCGIQEAHLYIRLVLASDFNLTPQISINAPHISTVGGTERVSPSVVNSGTLAADRDIEWRVTRFVLAPNRNYGTSPGSNVPCTYFRNYQGGTCQTIATGTRRFARGTTSLAAFDDAIGAYAIGTKICYATSVNPYKFDVNEWRHSAPQCTVVGKQPTAQLWGNDLRTGSAFTGTGNSNAKAVGALIAAPTGYKGTWVEYGVLAPRAVTFLSSGSGLARPGALAAQAEWSKLTAANTTAVYGNFAPTAASLGLQPDIAAYFLQPGLKGITVDNSPGNLSLGNMLNVTKAGSRVYIRLAGTVTITDNITLDDDTNLQDNSLFPQIVIIANNINIHHNVSRLDAWLIAKADAGGAGGVINTCSNQPATLTDARCDTPLVVNGPMIAKQLLLRRTAGDLGTPAEIVNLRSDAYLWANYISSLNSNWVTTSSSELPPRY